MPVNFVIFHNHLSSATGSGWCDLLIVLHVVGSNLWGSGWARCDLLWPCVFRYTCTHLVFLWDPMS